MFLQNIQAALDILLNLDAILALFGGVVIGTIIGAIPGMTVTMGVALTLPFTFSMHPAVGILLLLGVYKGGVYGGSITAILIKTPGTPAASCTVIDGFPMAQKGDGPMRTEDNNPLTADDIRETEMREVRGGFDPVPWPEAPSPSLTASTDPGSSSLEASSVSVASVDIRSIGTWPTPEMPSLESRVLTP